MLALLQDRRKEELGASRRDIQLTAGDWVLLDTEHTPLSSRSLDSPRWMAGSPFNWSSPF